MLENGKGESPREEIERRAEEFGEAMGGWLRALAKEGFKNQDQLSAVTEQGNDLLAKVGELEERLDRELKERLDALCKDLYGRSDAPRDPGPVPETKAEEDGVELAAPPLSLVPRKRKRPPTDMYALGLRKGDALAIRNTNKYCRVAGPRKIELDGEVVSPTPAVERIHGKLSGNGYGHLLLADGRSVEELRLDIEAAEAAKEKGNA